MKLDYQAALSAGYSDSEIKDFAKKRGVQLLNSPTAEGVGTFLKSAVNATGIPNFTKNAAAATGTLVGMGESALSNVKALPYGARDFLGNAAVANLDKAAKLREQTGTTGSVDQGVMPTLKTAWNVGTPTVQTGLTAAGLATAAPITLLKTAVGGSAIGGGISKVTGGTFSEGAGAGLGATPGTIAALKAIGYTKDLVVNSKPFKAIIDKGTNTVVDALGGAGQKAQEFGSKTDILKKITQRRDDFAKANPAKIDYYQVLSKAESEAQNLSPSVTNRIMAEIAKERARTDSSLDIVKALAKKSKMVFKPTSKTWTNEYNTIMKSILGDAIHTVAPDVAKMDAAYWLVKTAQSAPSAVLKTLGIPGSILLGTIRK